MKICSKCFREFNEREEDSHSPMMELGVIFLEHTAEVNAADYCPECRKELGIMNLAGIDY